MKRIYWVKKDPNLDSEDNWIKMNKAEFTRFMKSDAGKGRSFAQLDACDEKDNILIVECSRAQAIQCRKEKDHHDHLEKNRVESKIKTYSYNAAMPGEDVSNGESQLIDFENDVISNFLDQYEKEQLHKALLQLTRREYELIEDLFFCYPRKSEAEIAKERRVSQQAISKQKRLYQEKESRSKCNL